MTTGATLVRYEQPSKGSASHPVWPMSVKILFVANERQDPMDIQWISTGGIYVFPALK